MLIDAHQHYWKLERGDYDWLTPELEPLYRDCLPSELLPVLEANGVSGTVVVQAAASEEETHYLIGLARDNPSILGVVGWVDMESEDAAARLKNLVEVGGGLLKGIRPMIQDIDDTDWILSRTLDPVFEALVEEDLVFEALVSPIHLRSLRRRISAYPKLKTMIDHGAKPPIAERCRSTWSADLESLSHLPNVYCKLSGLVTEATQDWVEADIHPYMSEIFRLFAPHRVVWGSDWPVLNVASDYSTWLDLSRRFCGRFVDADRSGIFGGNALEFYGLKAPCLA